MKLRVLFSIFLCLLASNCAVLKQESTGFTTDPQGFASLEEVDPSIVIEMRYFGTHNFLGRKVAGYNSPKCLLTKEAAMALSQVQADLKPFSLSLKVYDCYRPDQAVKDFVAWVSDSKDTKMKAEFYPHIDKSELIRQGYIASQSGHSRGSTVDLTLVPIPLPVQPFFRDGEPLQACNAKRDRRFADNSLDMGTGYDCFDPMANTANPLIEKQAMIHRALLKSAMERRGFKNYDKEWWHFSLEKEPYPDRFFDFPVQ